jgi:hypothetical protein
MNEANKLRPLSVSQDAPIGLEGAPESGSRTAALVAGLGAALAGAIICATIVVQEQLKYDYVTVGLGFAVAVAVRKAGQGNTHRFAMVGAVCALLGCALAEVFSAAGFHAAHTKDLTSVLAVAQMLDDPNLAVQWVQTYFNPWSLLFYGIAIIEGYKLSRRPKW